nr:MAG TPA: hypothetical protein [Caudoviricetes sp.]
MICRVPLRIRRTPLNTVETQHVQKSRGITRNHKESLRFLFKPNSTST